MYKALSIILSPTTLLLACAVGIVTIIVVTRFIVQRHGKAQFRSLVDDLAVNGPRSSTAWCSPRGSCRSAADG